MATKKTRIAFQVAICISLLLVFWNIFWLSRLDQTPVPLKTSTTHLPIPSEDNSVKRSNSQNRKHEVQQAKLPSQEIQIAAVVCGNRVNETVVMIKSALITSSSVIRFIIFADEFATNSFKKIINQWPENILKLMHLELHPITFPSDKPEEWKKLFKPCASQRLFLPTLLDQVDSVLYMDTDTIFLTSPSHVWDHFSKMNEFQMAAVSPEHEDYSTGWYNRFARHPYFGNLGINSGVMLMNLTRMRQFGWEKYVVPIYQEYKTKITWGDQDIINIFFHFHPEKLYVYPCHYNYRPDHCMYMSVCKNAEEDGVFVLHGNRGSFHNEKQPAFKAIYSSFEQHSFEHDLKSDLLSEIKRQLSKTTDTNCGKMAESFSKAFENLLLLNRAFSNSSANN